LVIQQVGSTKKGGPGLVAGIKYKRKEALLLE
jgi:hypothetical protein